MEELKESVKRLVSEELERANGKFPMFHNSHEGYAVILEETEEAQDELTELKITLSYLWNSIKRNRNGLHDAEAIGDTAINLAAEAIQIAAMCFKYLDSIKED